MLRRGLCSLPAPLSPRKPPLRFPRFTPPPLFISLIIILSSRLASRHFLLLDIPDLPLYHYHLSSHWTLILDHSPVQSSPPKSNQIPNYIYRIPPSTQHAYLSASIHPSIHTFALTHTSPIHLQSTNHIYLLAYLLLACKSPGNIIDIDLLIRNTIPFLSTNEKETPNIEIQYTFLVLYIITPVRSFVRRSSLVSWSAAVRVVVAAPLSSCLYPLHTSTHPSNRLSALLERCSEHRRSHQRTQATNHPPFFVLQKPYIPFCSHSSLSMFPSVSSLFSPLSSAHQPDLKS